MKKIVMKALVYDDFHNIGLRPRELRWPNTVLAHALANAIQRAHKYCIKTNVA